MAPLRATIGRIRCTVHRQEAAEAVKITLYDSAAAQLLQFDILLSTMKIITTRVENYKIVEDSTVFSLGEVTCLVGKNESGKSALLEAIYKIKPVEEEEEGFVDIDFPRRNVSEYRDRSNENEHANVLTTTWELSEEDKQSILEAIGVQPLNSNFITLKKGYGSSLEWDLSLDQKLVIKHFIANANLSEDDKAKLSEAGTISDLIGKLNVIPERLDVHDSLLADLNRVFPKGTLTAAVTKILQDLLPTFLYFSDYFRLPGRASLDQISGKKAAGTLSREDKVFLSLLDLARSSLEEVQKTGTVEELNMELEAIQNRITGEIFEYWRQNRHLEAIFRLDQARPNDEPPFNSGFVFSTFIRNNRHKVSVPFDQRSTGFIWFVSFLVWFSQVKKHYGQNLLILLDEPGLNLHGTAQADLLRYIAEKLKPNFQVIYTTHSPFMIDPENLLAVRTVEDRVTRDDQGREVIEGTKVGDDVLSSDRETLLPLLGALGIDVTQTLFVGPNSLLVEGPSDILYLKWMTSELLRRGRQGLSPKWTLSPSGGLDKVSSFVALFSGKIKNIAVLADYGIGDKGKVERLRQLEVLKAGRVLTADQYASQTEADIEDLLGRTNYIELIKRTYALKGKEVLPSKKPAEAPIRCVKEVEDHMRLQANKLEFDHFEPARYFSENFETLKTDLPEFDAALDRFEAFFKDANNLLDNSH